MLDAGVPIQRALEFYAEGDPTDLGEVIDQVCTEVSNGHSLSFTMAKFPKVFSPVFLGLVQSGEKTGELSKMLGRLANLLEQEDRLISKIRAAITYPIFLALVSFSVGCIFMYVIIPALEPMLSGLGVQPPLPTRILMTIGKVIRNPFVLVGVPFSLVLLWFLGPPLLERVRKNEVWAERLDWIPMNIPIFGELYQRITLARVLFTVSTTIESGLTLMTAIELGRAVTSNIHFRAALDITRRRLNEGESLGESLAASGIFPDVLVQMLSIGEETATLSQVMATTANMYGEDAANRMEASVQLMEPLMLFGMGMVSGFLVLAAILPLVKMIDSL